MNETGKIVVYKNGNWKYVDSGVTWEFENDEDFLTTIPLKGLTELI